MTEATEPVYEADLLRDTGNGPTTANEEDILADIFGPADEAGVYGTQGGGCCGNCE